MPTRIVEQEPVSETVVHDSGSSMNSVLLATFVGLVVIAIIVLVILHATIGIL